jgi:hypothetical protein
MISLAERRWPFENYRLPGIKFAGNSISSAGEEGGGGGGGMMESRNTAIISDNNPKF